MFYRLGIYRGIFCAVWHDPALGTQRRSLGCKAKPEHRELAETRLAEFRSQQRKSEARPQGEVNIGRCLDGYWESHPDRVVKPHLRTFFAAMLPHHVDEDTCRRYIAKREKAGRSPSTIHTELTILKTALNWAEKKGWIDRSPVVTRPQPSPARSRWLTAEEYHRLVAAAGSPHIALFIKIATHTTARSGAILGLTWDRVSFDLNRIDFNEPGRARTKKRRAVVAMTADVRQALLEAREGALSDYVIEYGGGPVKSIKMAFRRAVARAGLEGVTPHTLRHTGATLMAQRGVHVWQIAGFLGNSVDMVDKVYGHHDPAHMSQATAALSAALDLGRAPPVQVNRSTVNKPRK